MGRPPRVERKVVLAGRGSRALVLLLLTSATAVTHGAKLLHLVGGEDAGELGVGLLEDGAHLLVALILAEAGVGVERGHLLVLIGEDGLDLRGLIVGQIQTLLEVLRGLLGIELVMVVTLLRCRLLCRGAIGGLLWGRLLGEGRRCGKSEGQSGTKKNALHVCLLLVAALRCSVLLDGINTDARECCVLWYADARRCLRDNYWFLFEIGVKNFHII